MALIQFLYICLPLVLIGAGACRIKGHPQTVTVDEGTWANFTCAIKGTGSDILWRIGEYTSNDDTSMYEGAYHLSNVEGITARRVHFSGGSGRSTETIEILATADLNGTPVECMCSGGRSAHSQFALLHVSSTETVSSSGEY